MHAQIEQSYGVAAEADGDLPTLSFPAFGSGRATHQSDPTRMGQLLCGGSFESVLWFRSRLGGEEDSSASDAGSKARRFWVEEVE